MLADVKDRDDEQVDGTSISRLKGMKIRDEFVCPITYELLRDPVVASDGHTYEKFAIEKWLKTNDKSPRTGEPMTGSLIPNINIRKLIRDIIEEGGHHLYTKDLGDKERIVDIRTEKLLIMECLGPNDSEWFGQNFQVNGRGCIGGRKYQQTELGHNAKDAIFFKDITVSRKHFEISRRNDEWRDDYSFYIKDLGSAGGTFIRIEEGTKKELHIGVIILIGKHQFTVSSIDDLHGEGRNSAFCSPTLASAGSKSRRGPGELLRSSVRSLVDNAKQLLEEISGSEFVEEEMLKSKLESLTLSLSPHVDSKTDVRRTVAMDAKRVAAEKDTDERDEHWNKQHDSPSSRQKFAGRRCVLTCCAPDGSPLQGQSFELGPQGGVLGRKTTCEVPLVLKKVIPGAYEDEKAEEETILIDSAISSEHAVVHMDQDTGSFYITDGKNKRPSTNGTWYRLSGPHQPSPEYELPYGAEVLFGTVRFIARQSKTISEYAVDHASVDSKYG